MNIFNIFRSKPKQISCIAKTVLNDIENSWNMDWDIIDAPYVFTKYLKYKFKPYVLEIYAGNGYIEVSIVDAPKNIFSKYEQSIIYNTFKKKMMHPKPLEKNENLKKLQYLKELFPECYK